MDKIIYNQVIVHPLYKKSKKKPPLIEINSGSCAWRRPTLPGPCGPSTIGAGGLNGRVRDGYVWNPSAIATKRASERNLLFQN